MEEQRFFGSDPEYFIYKNKKITEYGSIPYIIPPASLFTDFGVPFTETQNNKRVLLEDYQYRFIEDGAAIELNFKIPLSTSHELLDITHRAFDCLSRFLYRINSEFLISKEVLGFFDTNIYWKNRDKSFTDCVRFGCDPDQFPELYMINGFEKETCKITDASKHEYRYAGGHLHIQNMSNNPDIYYQNAELAPIIFDFIVGTSNIIINRPDNIYTQEKARLKYYGRPGRIRLQQYSDKINGIEYRPPSNHWLNSSYSVSSILASATIASKIIEANRAKDFFYTFQDKVYDMWKALTMYEITTAKNILADSLTWALENNIILLDNLEEVYGRF